jgi:hypothetical protein
MAREGLDPRRRIDCEQIDPADDAQNERTAVGFGQQVIRIGIARL